MLFQAFEKRGFMQVKRQLAIGAAGLAGALSLLAGGFGLQIGSAANNAEAQARHAVMIVRPFSCTAPEQTTMSAAAEGLVNGQRRSIPLRMEPLSGKEGGFSIARQWPDEGRWVVAVVASNPKYGDYRPGAVAPVEGERVKLAEVKRFSHAPQPAEIDASLGLGAVASR
jgi:hypothetical protein